MSKEEQAGERSIIKELVMWRWRKEGPVRKEREARRWSVAELAKQAGLPEVTVKSVDLGLHNTLPTPPTLDALAKVFGMDVIDLGRALASWIKSKPEDEDGLGQGRP